VQHKQNFKNRAAISQGKVTVQVENNFINFKLVEKFLVIPLLLMVVK
jgi:hypothetical protein